MILSRVVVVVILTASKHIARPGVIAPERADEWSHEGHRPRWPVAVVARLSPGPFILAATVNLGARHEPRAGRRVASQGRTGAAGRIAVCHTFSGRNGAPPVQRPELGQGVLGHEPRTSKHPSVDLVANGIRPVADASADLIQHLDVGCRGVSRHARREPAPGDRMFPRGNAAGSIAHDGGSATAAYTSAAPAVSVPLSR